jgi:hypothetical protein
MITPREMKQLFHAVTSMQTICISNVDYIDKMAVLKMLSGYCEEYPTISADRAPDGLGNTSVTWTLKWPILLTDVADEKEEPVP